MCLPTFSSSPEESFVNPIDDTIEARFNFEVWGARVVSTNNASVKLDLPRAECDGLGERNSLQGGSDATT
jgi:hypothetical protein